MSVAEDVFLKTAFLSGLILLSSKPVRSVIIFSDMSMLDILPGTYCIIDVC